MLSFSHPTADLSRPRSHNAAWIGGVVRPRRGFRLDHTAGVVGSGSEDFARVRDAMLRWDMARQSWTDVQLGDPDIEPGTQIAVVARVWPFWSVSVGMVTSIGESPRRSSISYGTTTDHVAVGEEEFATELCDNGDVVFSITAVSRPTRWWAWVGYPILRWSQARFRRGAVAAMRRVTAT